MVTAAVACGAAAADLTELAWRLLQVHDTLIEQVRTSARDVGGVSGEAYRVHASHSAGSVAGLASDVALLAGALAALGRALADVTELRALADEMASDEAADVRRQADDREVRAQARWRAAVADFEHGLRPVAEPDRSAGSEPPAGVRPPPGATAAATSSATAQPKSVPRRAPPASDRGPDPLEAEIVGRRFEAEIVRPGPSSSRVNGR